MKSLLLRYLFLCCLCCFFQGGFAAGTVVSWQAPKGAGLNNDFTVKVRPEGKSKWVIVPTYLVKVDEVRETKHHVEHASMATFDFSEKVEIAVTYNKGEIDSARVRPLSYDIPFTIEGNTLQFSLEKPANLSVEVNGDIFHNLDQVDFVGFPLKTRLLPVDLRKCEHEGQHAEKHGSEKQKFLFHNVLSPGFVVNMQSFPYPAYGIYMRAAGFP